MRHITAIPDPKYCISFAKQKEYVLFIKHFALELWEISTQVQDYTFLLNLKLEDNSSIISAAIHPNGTHLAYTTN